jgi:flagella basal body P-ring formation protein FlgA
MNNPRPVMSIRKTVQLMVILTILAWATQTLFAQWGRGGLILPPGASAPQTNDAKPGASAPGDSAPGAKAPGVAGAPAAATPAAAPVAIQRNTGGAVIELQPRAYFAGEGKITLRDVCKWSDYDAPIMEPLAGTLIAKIGNGPPVRQVTIDNVKSRLHDAGVNLAVMQFTGSAECRIFVADEKATEKPEKPAESEIPTPAPAPLAANAPTTQPQPQSIEEPEPAPSALTADTAAAAPAPIFEEQLVLTRPLSRGQRIIAGDIDIQRIQLDQPSTRPAITKDQIIGNVASRDLKKGEIFEPAFITRPAIVTKGQFMTVAMRIEQFDVETVARAMDSAAMGETVRAKNEANGDVYRVVVTAANEGRVESEYGSNTNPHKTDDVAAVSPN